jgi:uncharacterized protein
MAQSYFNETYVLNKEFTLGILRQKRFGDKFLVTSDHGGWVFLSKEELDKLYKGDLDADLFKILEEKGIIFTYNNKKLIHEYYTKRYEFLKYGTSLHILIPTLRCNFKCIYCHSSAKPLKNQKYDMDKPTAKKTLEFIFQTPAQSITIEFQGGDALMNLDLFQYIVHTAKEINLSSKKDVKFALVTNLTLMNDDILAWIIDEKDISICSSLDGPAFLHDLNRRYETGKPSYKDVTKWIEKITAKTHKPPGLLMVTTKASLPYYKEIIDEYVRFGQKEIQIKYINKLGFAAPIWQKIGYSMDEFIDFWRKSMDYMLELNKKGILVWERYAKLILQKILTTSEPSFLDFRMPCGIVIGQLAYNYNGDIYSCDEGRNFELFKIGNVSKDAYKDVVTSDKSLELVSTSINDNYLCDNCIYKPYCGVCPVMCYAEEGNLIPKLASNSRCKQFKFMFNYIFEKLLNDPEARDIFFSWIKQ